MHSAASEQETSSWLVNDSSKELELLLWAVLSHQSEAYPDRDNDSGQCVDASAGAGKLLGISMRQMIGESIKHLLQPNKIQHAASEGSAARASCPGAQRQFRPEARDGRQPGLRVPVTGFR